jgi:hypothetical protein
MQNKAGAERFRRRAEAATVPGKRFLPGQKATNLQHVKRRRHLLAAIRVVDFPAPK